MPGIEPGARVRVAPSRVLAVASFGAFLAFLDATIVNVAFPSIRDSFPESSIGALSWVLNAYNIVFAAFLIVCGRLTDLLGRRRAFVGGIALFTLASALCGAAPSLEFLVAARVLQALGAALLVPASWPSSWMPSPASDGRTPSGCGAPQPPSRPASAHRSAAPWSSWAGGAGPSSSTSRSASWPRRGAAPARRESRAGSPHDARPGRGRRARRLPGCLEPRHRQGQRLGLEQPGGPRPLRGGDVLTTLFVVSSRRHRSPLLDPALLRIRSFSLANGATVLAGLGFYAYLLTNILWLQYVWGYDVLLAGLALVPGALVAAVVAALLGPRAERHGYRPFVVPGALVWAGAYVWYHEQVGLEPAFWSEWLPGQVLSGIGVGATLPLLGSAALAAVPGGRYATASAVVSSARQLGGVLGIAFLVAILGTPTPATAAAVLRDGWLLSIGAFLAVAVLALPLGRLTTTTSEEGPDDDGEAVVHIPDRAGATREPRCGRAARRPAAAGRPAGCRPGTARSRHPALPVHAGEWLIREGDPSGSAYLVRSGRLEVEVGGRLVRELGPGDVLGELALLTGERRSAAVRARRDSHVVEVPRARSPPCSRPTLLRPASSSPR